MTSKPAKDRILLFGATGTIGRAVLDVLRASGKGVLCVVRRKSQSKLPAEVKTVEADVTDADEMRAVFQNGPFAAVISCMASRTGAPADAWAIDHHANSLALTGAKFAGVPKFILLSAICVQKPRLAFQHAKRAFEQELIDSGLIYSIVRPTAYFKSLSGQIKRVQAGKPFLVFGDGTLTSCKPISDADLASYIVSCLGDPQKQNQILPIGGPGPAITPMDQAAMLSELLGRDVKVRYVPIAMMNAIIGGLSVAGWCSAKMRDKAEFARTGRYYATESMLVWDKGMQRYDADATPEFGADTLRAFYARVLSGEETVELGDQGVF
ncbi:MAG: NAD(P)H-binding protein [Pseudomonadota bacterium]